MGVHFTICRGCGTYVGSDITDHQCVELSELDALRSVIDRLSKESDSWHAIAMDTLSELDQVKAERDYWRGNAEDYASMLAATSELRPRVGFVSG